MEAMHQLGMFAKYWAPGAVKTRLAAAIGPRQASEVYRACLQALVRRLRSAGDRRVIAYTPQRYRADFEELAGRDWSLELQAAGDLGGRMAAFFSQALQRDRGAVVLIGSDSPTLPVEYVQDAFKRLDEVPVVLGPSRDGGYYLIGASGHLPCVFSGVLWSSPQVYQQTVSLLRAAQCAYAELPPWYDVDDLEDLMTLRRELAAMQELDDTLRSLLEIVERVLGASGDGQDAKGE
jgi:rSAM/selenodomain-associated transferase 1